MSLRLGVVLLAAGFGRRFGSAGKLHQMLNDRPVLAWALQTLAALQPVAAVAVIAPEDAAASALARAAGFQPVPNPARADGMGSSLACGASALPGKLDAVLVALGDMPRVREDTCRRLLAAFDQGPAARIVLPVYGGRRGHPVLFGAGHLPALRALTGDSGARSVLAAHADAVLEVPVDDAGVLLDIDTPAQLAAAEGSGGDRPGFLTGSGATHTPPGSGPSTAV